MKPNLHVLGASYTEPATKANPFEKIGLALLPFTPVPLSGPDALYAWGRLILYGGAAAYFFTKKKNSIATVFAGAAGLSLLTSVTAKAWEEKK